MSERPKRPSMPVGVKLLAALAQLGFTYDEVEFDHSPALALRPLNPDGTDTDPPANDHRHIVIRPKALHKAKTFGPGGEKRIHTKGSDISEIAKAKRLEAQRTMTNPAIGKLAKVREKRRWPKRKMGGKNAHRDS